MAKAAWNIISGLFLSTPSVRRATPIQTPHRQKKTIPIHALREEGDKTLDAMAGWAYDFYPRPPRGGRPGGFSAPSTNILFLSTPSARRATGRSALRMKRNNCISIHALREEGDLPGLRCAVGASQFLSTPSARRATVYHRQRTHHSGISIHALREEGDRVTLM